LTNELKTCNESISCLKYENINLIAKIEKLNACYVTANIVQHVTICTRCRDIYVNAISDHLAIIKEQNDHITKLNAKIVEHELENEKFKLARSMLYNGDAPDIKDDIGFQTGSQDNELNAYGNKISNFVKGKAPMAQDRECYILYPENCYEYKIRRIHAKKSHCYYRECKFDKCGTRQRILCRVPNKKHSAKRRAFGKEPNSNSDPSRIHSTSPARTITLMAQIRRGRGKSRPPEPRSAEPGELEEPQQGKGESWKGRRER
jgi:hypothetical protein